MQFWCSATGQAWSWHWRAYPGAWLFVALLVAGYVVLHRRSAIAWPGWRTCVFGLGVVAAWAAIDWPIGALGSGYLLSLHEVQYLLLSVIAPPLLLLGIPPEVTLESSIARSFARPLPALVIYHLGLVVTHVPALSDALMPTQLGSMAIDLTWLLSGLWFWWAVVAPEGINRLRPPLRMLYLFVSTILPTVPAAFLTFASYPIYRLYELAPPVAEISAHTDQMTAGILMKLGADPIVWVAMAITFFRWAKRDGN